MASGKAGARVKAQAVGCVRIHSVPHAVFHILTGLYIIRPVQPRGMGDNVNRVRYISWEALKKDYPDAERYESSTTPP